MQAAGISGGGTKDDFSEIIAQVQPNPGMPERKAATRHRRNVEEIIHTLPANAQEAVRRSMEEEDKILAENRAQAAVQANLAQSAAAAVAAGSAAAGVTANRAADDATDVFNTVGEAADEGNWVTPSDADTAPVRTDDSGSA